MRIKIQLEFHQEIADITLLCPFIFPLNLAICCVTSLVNRRLTGRPNYIRPGPGPRRRRGSTCIQVPSVAIVPVASC